MIEYFKEMNELIVSELIKTCEHSLKNGPKYGLQEPYTQTGNGGYLNMKTLLDNLVRHIHTITPVNEMHSEQYCGLHKNAGELVLMEIPFVNEYSLSCDLYWYMRLFIKNINRNTNELYIKGVINKYYPWYIIRIVLLFYQENFNYIYEKQKQYDPDYNVPSGTIVEEVNIFYNQHFTICSYCSKARSLWMNELFTNYFIKTSQLNSSLIVDTDAPIFWTSKINSIFPENIEYRSTMFNYAYDSYILEFDDDEEEHNDEEHDEEEEHEDGEEHNEEELDDEGQLEDEEENHDEEQEDEEHYEEDDEEEHDEEEVDDTIRKQDNLKKSLRNIQDLIDTNVKGLVEDNVYLKLMNELKIAFNNS